MIPNVTHVVNDGVQQGSNNITEVVSNFVETIREQQAEQDVRRSKVATSPEFVDAQRRNEKAIIEAEKYKAAIQEPEPGKRQSPLCFDSYQTSNREMNLMNTDHNIPNIRAGVSDDDFFYLTCHIEPNLIHKIEKGEFVDMDKLLPKERSGMVYGKEEDVMEWVRRDGNMFLAPVNRHSKITGIRKWEQAFRAYTTIYCAANPHRSKEIWQYIVVINTAVASYYWDSVYNYDITFRHLMAFNPNRSWAVTYNQMWNLSMKDPLPKNNNQQRGHGPQPHSSIQGQNFLGMTSSRQNFSPIGGNNNSRRNKSDYCWNFNKGLKCKFGKACRYVERCSYCDSPLHGMVSCPKLGGHLQHKKEAIVMEVEQMNREQASKPKCIYKELKKYKELIINFNGVIQL